MATARDLRLDIPRDADPALLLDQSVSWQRTIRISDDLPRPIIVVIGIRPSFEGSIRRRGPRSIQGIMASGRMEQIMKEAGPAPSFGNNRVDHRAVMER